MGMTQEWIVCKERSSPFPPMATSQVVRRQFYPIIFPLMFSTGVIQQSWVCISTMGCGARTGIDLRRFSLRVCFEQLWDPFLLMNNVLLYLISAISSKTLRDWEHSPPDPFLSGLFNWSNSSIAFPVYIWKRQCIRTVGVETPEQDRFGFVCGAVHPGASDLRLFSTSFLICKKERRLVPTSWVLCYWKSTLMGLW